MMGGTIDAVVFDIGGVLIDWNPRHLYRKLFDDDAAMTWFLDHVCNAEWNAHQDRGRPFADGIAELIRRYPTWRALIEAYWARWIEMISGPIDGTVDLLELLRGRPVRLLGLSNWSAETFPLIRERYAFLSWFEGIVVSGEEAVAKPDTEIFERLVDRYHLEPTTTLFIDDSDRNVAAAQALGFRVIKFTTARALRDQLVAANVLVA